MPPRSSSKSLPPAAQPVPPQPLEDTITLADEADDDLDPAFAPPPSPPPPPQTWRNAPPGTPVNVNSRLTGLEADILRAVSHQDDSVMDAVKRALNIAAHNDAALRAFKIREREDQERIQELIAQVAIANVSLTNLATAYTGLQQCHDAMVKHLEAVTAFQQRTATAAESVASNATDTRSRLIRAINALEANTTAQRQAVDSQSRFRDDVAYLNGLVDSLTTLLDIPPPPPPQSPPPAAPNTASPPPLAQPIRTPPR